MMKPRFQITTTPASTGEISQKGNKLMENLQLEYKEVNGLFYPQIELPMNQEDELAGLGKYGRMAMAYLKEHDSVRFKSLYRFGRLGRVLNEVETEANELFDQLMERYLQTHKPQNPSSTMEMWQLREQAKQYAEEIVLLQVIYRHR